MMMRINIEIVFDKDYVVDNLEIVAIADKIADVLVAAEKERKIFDGNAKSAVIEAIPTGEKVVIAEDCTKIVQRAGKEPLKIEDELDPEDSKFWSSIEKWQIIQDTVFLHGYQESLRKAAKRFLFQVDRSRGRMFLIDSPRSDLGNDKEKFVFKMCKHFQDKYGAKYIVFNCQ